MASQGVEGASALSDMHAKWSEKGAHEFVPTNPQSFANKAPAMPAMRPPRGPQNMGRMPPMAMQNPWAGANMNFMPEGQWNMQAQFAKGTAYGAATRNFAAVWNLKADYKASELLGCLNKHDFYPECQEVDPGSFLLIFEKTWQAAAFVISFDDSVDILKTGGGKAHTACFNNETGKWNKEELTKAQDAYVGQQQKRAEAHGAPAAGASVTPGDSAPGTASAEPAATEGGAEGAAAASAEGRGNVASAEGGDAT